MEVGVDIDCYVLPKFSWSNNPGSVPSIHTYSALGRQMSTYFFKGKDSVSFFIIWLLQTNSRFGAQRWKGLWELFVRLSCSAESGIVKSHLFWPRPGTDSWEEAPETQHSDQWGQAVDWKCFQFYLFKILSKCGLWVPPPIHLTTHRAAQPIQVIESQDQWGERVGAVPHPHIYPL